MAASQIEEQASQFANSIHVATCWWKKSCTRWCLPIIYRVFYIQTVVGLGISETSTVKRAFGVFLSGKKCHQTKPWNATSEARAKGLSRHHQSDQPESPWISVYHDGQPWLPSRSLTASPWKGTFPIGKDRLPTIIFQGRAVKLPGGRWWFVSNIFYVHPRTLGKMNPIWLLHIFQMGWVKTNYN